MINDLLDISKIEAGRFIMKRGLVDLNVLIKKAYEFFEPLANKSSIKFKLTLPKDSIRIWADHDKIFEVISNLVSNAIKYNVRGGSINIVVFDKDNEAIISVKDTGCGIARDDIPKIFRRYEGLHFSKDKNIDSTGLGLSITKEIVDLHKGKIEVESQLGRGSNFILSLPIDLRAAR
jgi:signal transduction histidine kinase